MRLRVCKSHAADDGWHRKFQSVVGHGVRPEDDALQVELPVRDDLFDDGPVDPPLLRIVALLRRGFDSSVGNVTEFQEAGFMRVKPFGASRRVGKGEEADGAESYGYDPFDDEATSVVSEIWCEASYCKGTHIHRQPS